MKVLNVVEYRIESRRQLWSGHRICGRGTEQVVHNDSGARERSELCGASERVNEQMSEWPVTDVPISKNSESLCSVGDA